MKNIMEYRAILQVLEYQKIELMPDINPLWFNDSLNLEIWKNIVFAFKEYKAIDVETLRTYIHKNNNSESMKSKLNGRLNDILNAGIYPSDYLLKDFEEYYIQNKLNSYVQHHTDKTSTIGSRKRLYNEIYKTINQNIKIGESQNLEQNINEYIQQIILLEKGENTFTDRFKENSIELHNPILKKIFGRYLRPFPIGIGADPGFHKSSLNLNLLVDINYNKIPGLIFSFEDTIDTLRAKYLAIKYDIPINRIINHLYEKEDIEKLTKKQKNKNIWVIDKQVDLIKFREIVDRHVMLYGIKYILIDYFQFFRCDYKMGKVESLELIAKEFVNIRKDYEIPIVVLSTLTEQDGAEPNLKSWKWCTDLAANLRQAVFLYGDRQSNIRKIKIAKNTFAGLDDFEIVFNRESQRLENE